MIESRSVLKQKIFIDGQAGTTGLRIRQWIQDRRDIQLLTLADSDRRSATARQQAISLADLTILCLPDEAAAEAAIWANNAGTRVLDASTCHRVADDWTYGLPELCEEQRARITSADCVSNPGCYSSTFILLLRPLIDAGLMPTDAPIFIHALSGYSGGGKSMIERWENPDNELVNIPYEVPYALERIHKHIPEMQRYTGLTVQPQFLPAVGSFHSGMRVQVPLHESIFCNKPDGEEIWSLLDQRYEGERFVHVAPFAGFEATSEFDLDPTRFNESNQLQIHVYPNPAGHILLVGLLDNLGKGASGVAVQCLNLMLGLPEHAGLPA